MISKSKIYILRCVFLFLIVFIIIGMPVNTELVLILCDIHRQTKYGTPLWQTSQTPSSIGQAVVRDAKCPLLIMMSGLADRGLEQNHR